MRTARDAGGSGEEEEEKRTAAMDVASSIINTLIDNVYEVGEVLQRKQDDQLGGEIASGIEGEGGSPGESSGDTDSESSDEGTESSSEDDSARAVGTASRARENGKLQVTAVEDGFTRVSTREEKKQAKRELQREKEKKRVELAAKAKEEEKRDREIQRKLWAEASQRNPHTRARAARERQEAQAKAAEGRAQRPMAQRGGGAAALRGRAGRAARGGRGRGGGSGRGNGGPAGGGRSTGGPAGTGGRAASAELHPPKQATRRDCWDCRCRVAWIQKQRRTNENWEWKSDEEPDNCSSCGWKWGRKWDEESICYYS